MTNQDVITFLPFKIHDKNSQALSFQQQTKLNFLTNSLTTLFSVLVKLNHEGRKLISKAENSDSEILS